MATSLRYTSTDLEGLPTLDGVRYEIVDGELYVSKQPEWHHQYACGEIAGELRTWSRASGLGVVLQAPGVIFASDDNVAPDLVWFRRERLPTIFDEGGHLQAAPELIVEVLSPGAENERRDRELKLKLYSRQGVQEYWIVDWRLRRIQVFRRHEAALELVATYQDEDRLTSPLLPGFGLSVGELWEPA